MFKFRLQRVLDLRARTERDAATALVSAQEAADAARVEQQRLEQARAEMAARITTGMAAGGDAPPSTEAPAGASVGALRNFSFLLDRLDEHVAGAAQQSAAAQHAVTAREDALRAAYRERRTLDRLRERHQDAWRAGEAAIDRVQMDEIALTRFTQPGVAGARSTDTTES